MNDLRWAHEVDAIATGDPERLGHGYADSQFAWRHAPAIDLPRTVALDVLRVLRGLGRAPSILVVGRCGGGGLLQVLTRFARRVVLIAPDAAAAAPALAAPHAALAGDAEDPAVAAAAAELLPSCDGLLLDTTGGGAAMRRLWARYAALVRPGGQVLLVDRTQAAPCFGAAGDGVDAFVAELQRDVLAPADVRLQRLGGALAVFTYQQPVATAELPARFAAVPPAPRCAATLVAGFRLADLGALWCAVPADEPEPTPHSLWHNRHAVVLAARDRSAMAGLAAAFHRAEPELTAARTALAAGRAGSALEQIGAVAIANPDLAEGLGRSLERAPWNRRLLLALGTLWLATGHPREGVALLRKALRIKLGDSDLLRTIAAVCTDVLADPAAARETLEAVKAQVRERRLADTCRGLPGSNLLWQYPQLLDRLRSVVHVGAGRGDDVPAWSALEFAEQTHVEAHPELAERLRARCALAGERVQVLQVAVGGTPGAGTLRWGRDPAVASLCRQHPLAQLRADECQANSCEVEVQTLDDLLARGDLRDGGCDVLHLDVEGAELDVLRGAVALLQHVQVVSVVVAVAPLYADAPLPQQIQAFLHDGVDGVSFGLCAYEPRADGRRGQLLFRRPEED